MPSRRIKSLKKDKGARMHREHRSKKGRKNMQSMNIYSKKYRREKAKIKEDECSIEKF